MNERWVQERSERHRISPQRLERFRARIAELRSSRERIHAKWTSDGALPASVSPRALSTEALELAANLERELDVANEELAVQEEQLSSTLDQLERERGGFQEAFECSPDACIVTDRMGVSASSTPIAPSRCCPMNCEVRSSRSSGGQDSSARPGSRPSGVSAQWTSSSGAR
ncbi:MAG: hypothetical protein U0414_42725 [Polyangiaceae bacterium]